MSAYLPIPAKIWRSKRMNVLEKTRSPKKALIWNVNEQCFTLNLYDAWGEIRWETASTIFQLQTFWQL